MRNRNFARRVLILVGLACAIHAAPFALAADAPAVKVLKTPDGIRYGLLGEKQSAPAPTLCVFATDFETTLQSPDYNKAGKQLLPDGWICVSIDIPCHGEDARPGEPGGLSGWRARLEKGEDFVTPFTTKVSKVIDQLIADGYSDPKRIAAAGTSRGGFIALQCAAAEPRLSAVAVFAPVTNLARLTEFAGLEGHERVKALEIRNLADKLAGRPVWMCIGNHDERVGTNDCVAAGVAIAKAAIDKKLTAPIEVHVMPSVGHRIHATAHDEAAVWFRANVK